MFIVKLFVLNLKLYIENRSLGKDPDETICLQNQRGIDEEHRNKDSLFRISKLWTIEHHIVVPIE